MPEAKAAHEFCKSTTPNAEGEPLPDSTQTRCLDKKEGTETFSCEGSYSEIGEECGQTFEADKKDLQKEIKNEREFCRESEDATCKKGRIKIATMESEMLEQVMKQTYQTQANSAMIQKRLLMIQTKS